MDDSAEKESKVEFIKKFRADMEEIINEQLAVEREVAETWKEFEALCAATPLPIEIEAWHRSRLSDISMRVTYGRAKISRYLKSVMARFGA